LTIAICLSFESAAFPLATAPASRNITARQHIEATFKRSNIRFARLDYEKRLLAENNAPCLLLACGRYLISEEVAANDVRLIQNIAYLDIQAVMQIIRNKDRSRYNEILSLVLSRMPRQDDSIPIDLYAEDVISRAFQFLSPIHEKVMSESDIPPDEAKFIEKIRPIISDNMHYFPEGFWRSDIRGKDIRDARNNGMVFYNAGSFTTSKHEHPDDSAVSAVAVAFVKKRNDEGIMLGEAHAEIISAMIRRLGDNTVSPHDDPDQVIANVFKKNDVKRILDVGCGDSSFLAALSSSAAEAGVELTGIDRDPRPLSEAAGRVLKKLKIKVIKGDAAELDDEHGFDIITASGVMSLIGSMPGWQLQDANMGYQVYRKSLLNAYDLIQNLSGILSPNPGAAIYANSFGSMLMLNRSAISEFVHIAEWDSSRKCDMEMPRANMGEKVWLENWVPLWKQAASFAVMTRKKSDNPDVKKMAGVEMEQASILLGDLVNAGLNEGRVYEIAYDTSRLSFAQRQIVEEYIELIRARADKPGNIRNRPFVRPIGSKEPLFQVRASGKSFSGEGHVDIADENNLENYFLRIPSMMNMALAASNIPDCSTDSDLEPYLPIISYIKTQYNNITGGVMELPKIASEIVARLRFIPLPKPERVDPNLLDEYNRIAKDMLMSAA